MSKIGYVELKMTEIPEVKAFFIKLSEVLNAHPNNVVTKEVLSVIDECWPDVRRNTP